MEDTTRKKGPRRDDEERVGERRRESAYGEVVVCIPAVLLSILTGDSTFFVPALFRPQSKLFGGLATGGLQIRIDLSGTPESHPDRIKYIRHRPSWKVRKNVFLALKNRQLQDGPQQQQQQAPQQYGMSKQDQPLMVYSDDHDTEGEVTLAMPPGKKLDHMGVQIRFFGRIDMVR